MGEMLELGGPLLLRTCFFNHSAIKLILSEGGVDIIRIITTLYFIYLKKTLATFIV